MKISKRRFAKVIITATLALSLMAGSFAYAGTTVAAASSSKATAEATSVIKWSEAKAIFKDKLPAKAAIKYLHLTKDDGIQVYKGKATKGNYVYSVEINAVTGKIEAGDFERENKRSRYTASSVGAVSKATIRAKIRRQVPNAVIIYVKLTRDDGRYVYEAEAYKKGYEYDFEFTKSGRLIESERDKV